MLHSATCSILLALIKINKYLLMALSSNSLIHFTKSLASLKGILKNNFKISYCRETIWSEEKKKDLLIPMVSFCDIPFSQIIGHVKNYGSYGIGLKKKWAESKGLNPVLYVEKNSSLSHNIVHNLFETVKGDKKKISELSEQDKYNLDHLRYLKNYQADLIRIGKAVKKDYRFSDEREWRYVLDPLDECQLFAVLKEEFKENFVTGLKKRLGDKAESKRLLFTPDDISYIIIKKETERDNIIKLLETVNGKYPHDQVKRLTSRIISVEQLETDF
jgi:hypothetical protein